MDSRPDGDSEDFIREWRQPIAEEFKAPASTRSQTLERGNQ